MLKPKSESFVVNLSSRRILDLPKVRFNKRTSLYHDGLLVIVHCEGRQVHDRCL